MVDAQRKGKVLFYSQTGLCKERLISKQPEGPERGENIKAWCISHQLQMSMCLGKGRYPLPARLPA